jgi:MOSC domain-containing protein YiiM
MDGEIVGRVVSLNVGSVREVAYRGKTRTTAIWKDPTPGRLGVHRDGVVGDHQADPKFHGGPRKAVYAYSMEDTRWWENELGTAIRAATFGENLTLEGISINDAVLGEQWRVGGAMLEVTQPRFPCWKLGLRMGDPKFPRRFLAAGRAGTYLSVVEEGEVGAGDPVTVVSQPAHPVTVGLIAHLNHADRALALVLLEAAEAGITPQEWRKMLSQAGLDPA